jgi:flagellar hook-basal body complex protein FliE
MEGEERFEHAYMALPPEVVKASGMEVEEREELIISTPPAEIAGEEEPEATVRRPPVAVPGSMEPAREAIISPEASLPPETIIVSREVIDNTPRQVSAEEEAQDKQIKEPVALGASLVAPVAPSPDVEEDMPLPVPQLPEMTSMMSAIQSLDKQTAEMREHLQKAKTLEEQAQQLRDQLKAATEQISLHDNKVAQLAQQLRVGVADVATRLKQVVDEVSRAEESLSVADMMKLIEDVRNDPRDIYTVGSLARRARELAQFFELHQRVNQILSECLMTLNDLMAIDVSKSEE